MTEFFTIMIMPFLACLVLTGIHAYLGLHVIKREVIFVDLALAQIAALGMSFALILGHSLDGSFAYWLSLAFTVVGAGIFSLVRSKSGRIPQEAVIGITYAVSAALLVLVLSRSGEGDEHIREAFIGNILLVSGADVLKIAVIYAFVGAFHFAFRKRFFLITSDPASAARSMSVRFWDFLFYVSFGVVVTSSVKIAGVLLVFSFLVVPAAGAVLFYSDVRRRLIFGWILGMAVSVTGITISYFFDLPTGASVVCAFGAALALLAAGKALFRR